MTNVVTFTKPYRQRTEAKMENIQMLGFLIFANLLCGAIGYALGRAARNDRQRRKEVKQMLGRIK